MGQQQLLLIVLGVIIVGIAIAVGITMFRSNSITSNRDQVISDLNNLAAQAQQYYRKPTSMGGGSQSFVGFKPDSGMVNDANGFYKAGGNGTSQPTISSLTLTKGDTTSVAAGDVSATDGGFYILGQGNTMGNNSTKPVGACSYVTQNGTITTTVIN